MECSFFGLIKTAAMFSSFYRWNVQNFRMWKIQLISAKTTILIPHEELEHKGEKLRHTKSEVKQPKIE